MTQPLFEIAVKLTPRQELVYQATADRPMLALTAGILLHQASCCRYCKPDVPCQFADRNGREVLEALRTKGLLKRDRHHVYRRVDATSDTSAGGYDPATEPIPF